MSASAINPAPSPSPAAGPATAASGATGGAHAAQAQDPLAAFEAMLASLFGVKEPAAGAAATGAGKTPTDGKTADGKVADGKKGKDQTAGDDQTVATADTTGAANPNLALLSPTAATLPAAAPPSPTGADDPVQPAIANVASATDRADANAAALADAAAKAASGKADPDAKGDAAKVAAQTAEPVSLPTAASAAATAATAAKAAVTAAAPSTPAAEPAPDATTPPPAATAAPAPEAPAVTAAVVPPPAAPTARKTTDPVAPAAPRERIQATKTSTRVEAVKAQAAPGGIAALTAKAAEALQPVSGGAPGVETDDEPVQEAPPEAKPDAGSAPQAPANPATAATTAQTNLVHAAAVAVRGQPQTVANLAAQIVKKLDGRSSQFDVQLDPAGLGKVDVRIAIGADGRMSAAMSFDTPQAAAELKARAGELHQAMAQAGFDLTGGMSFDVTSDPGQGQGNQAQTQDQQANTGAAFRGRAFQTALDTSADAAPPQFMRRRTALAGVDIRI